MPVLETARLVIRPFTLADLPAVHRILDVELADVDLHTEGELGWAERAEWLRWSALNYRQLDYLNQPPYGDRAVALKETGELIGACGLVPYIAPVELLPGWAGEGQPGVDPEKALASAEVGLYYAISPAHQRRGCATEAAQALIDYTFRALRLGRIIATTDFANAASIGVMRKLRMRILRNPYPEPVYMQVVAVLENMVH